MSNKNEHLQTLTEIRSLMEQSTRFLSLSGLSGIAAGVIALIGAAVAYAYVGADSVFLDYEQYRLNSEPKWGMDYMTFILLDASIVLLLALAAGSVFTSRKARRKGLPLWTMASQKLLLNLAVPLLTGGAFCLILLEKGYVDIIAPCTLLFYGLALINGSKYTVNDIRYLGISEIVLGLISAYFTGYGLFFWAVGFGILHIIYGTAMYLKYEKEE